MDGDGGGDCLLLVLKTVEIGDVSCLGPFGLRAPAFSSSVSLLARPIPFPLALFDGEDDMGVMGGVESSDALRRPPNAFLNLNPFDAPNASVRGVVGTGDGGGSGWLCVCPIFPMDDEERLAGGGQCRFLVDGGVDRGGGTDESGLTGFDWPEFEVDLACCSVCDDADLGNEVKGSECCDRDAAST